MRFSFQNILLHTIVLFHTYLLSQGLWLPKVGSFQRFHFRKFVSSTAEEFENNYAVMLYPIPKPTGQFGTLACHSGVICAYFGKYEFVVKFCLYLVSNLVPSLSSCVCIAYLGQIISHLLISVTSTQPIQSLNNTSSNIIQEDQINRLRQTSVRR